MLQVTEEVAFAVLLALPGVSGVGAVRSQGNVKHYTVSYVFKNGGRLDPQVLERLTGVWPFGAVEADPARGTARVEFLVRPDEVAAFSAKMADMQSPLSPVQTAAIALEFSEEVSRKLRARFGKAVRATDRVEWDGKTLRVILADCLDVGAVEGRLLDLAKEAELTVVDIRREAC